MFAQSKTIGQVELVYSTESQSLSWYSRFKPRQELYIFSGQKLTIQSPLVSGILVVPFDVASVGKKTCQMRPLLLDDDVILGKETFHNKLS